MVARSTFKRLLILPALACLVLTSAAASAQIDGGGATLEERLGVARELWRSGDPQAARARLEAILSEADPSTPEGAAAEAAAQVGLADIAWRLGDDRLAGALDSTVLESSLETSWSGAARLGLARAFVATGAWQAAGQVLQDVQSGSADPSERDAAAHRLMLLDRFELRPLAGESGWRSCDLVSTLATDPGKLVGVTVTPEGAILVAGRQGLIRFGTDGEIEDQIAWPSTGSPFVDSDGAVFLVGDESIEEVSQQRHDFALGSADRSRPVTGLVAGGRDDWQRWLLLSTRADGALLFSPQGDYLSTLEGLSGFEPIDLARDSRGRLLILDGRGGRVLRLNFDTLRPEVVLSGDWKRPRALAIDLHDNLYILDRAQRAVLVYRSDGELIASLGPELRGGCELKAPEDLAVDAWGRIFVADSRSKAIVVID